MSSQVFEAVSLGMKFGKKQVLDDLEFSLQAGEVTVLLGANGAGKTTLMKLALGTLAPSWGTLHLLGFDPIKQAKKMRQRIGFVPSVPDAYGWMSFEDLRRFLRPQYPTWNDLYTDGLLDRLLVPRNTAFAKMSRGEGMKAMLVAALAPKPELLLLDEPFAGLDPLARREVLSGVLGELRDEKRTVLCATHDLEIASRLADRVAVLAGGRIVEHGSLEEVLGEEPAQIPERMYELLKESVAV